MGASFSLCIPPPASVKQEEKELDELLDFLHLKMEKRLSIGVAYSSSMVTGLSEERKRLVLLFHWKNQATLTDKSGLYEETISIIQRNYAQIPPFLRPQCFKIGETSNFVYILRDWFPCSLDEYLRLLEIEPFLSDQFIQWEHEWIDYALSLSVSPYKAFVSQIGMVQIVPEVCSGEGKSYYNSTIKEHCEEFKSLYSSLHFLEMEQLSLGEISSTLVRLLYSAVERGTAFANYFYLKYLFGCTKKTFCNFLHCLACCYKLLGRFGDLFEGVIFWNLIELCLEFPPKKQQHFNALVKIVHELYQPAKYESWLRDFDLYERFRSLKPLWPVCKTVAFVESEEKEILFSSFWTAHRFYICNGEPDFIRIKNDKIVVLKDGLISIFDLSSYSQVMTIRPIAQFDIESAHKITTIELEVTNSLTIQVYSTSKHLTLYSLERKDKGFKVKKSHIKIPKPGAIYHRNKFYFLQGNALCEVKDSCCSNLCKFESELPMKLHCTDAMAIAFAGNYIAIYHLAKKRVVLSKELQQNWDSFSFFQNKIYFYNQNSYASLNLLTGTLTTKDSPHPLLLAYENAIFQTNGVHFEYSTCTAKTITPPSFTIKHALTTQVSGLILLVNSKGAATLVQLQPLHENQ